MEKTEKTEKTIGGKTVWLFSAEKPDFILVQPAGLEELPALDTEVETVTALTGGSCRFALAAFSVHDWQRELSPWEAPPVFGTEGFGAGAEETLSWLLDALLPSLDGTGDGKVVLGGYSLAGLFALWAAYRTDRFLGTAAVSPSVWFPRWDAFADTHRINAPFVYLSLGIREPKTRNRIMAGVGEAIQRQYERTVRSLGTEACELEWNSGNHFSEPEIRTAKGFAWIINNGKKHCR